MSKKCRAYSESRLGLEPSDNRKAFYAGWDAAIHSALSEQPAQQQEPVAVYVGETWCGSVVRLYEELPLETPLYTSPPASKPWVGLTESEIEKLAVESGKATFLNDNEQTDILWFDGDCISLVRAIEAKLQEKNA